MEPELLPIEVLHLWESRDLDLDPMNFLYELDPYSLELYRMCGANMNFLVNAFDSCRRQRDRQTDRQIEQWRH